MQKPVQKPAGGVGAGAFSTWLRRYSRIQMQPQQGSDVPCGTCNACCRSSYFIHIHADEHEALRRIPSEYLTRAPQLDVNDWIMNQNVNGRCPMLKADGCSIYAHRPRTCRNYDCRAFAAAGISLGTGLLNAINERVWQWCFDYPTELDRQRHCAVRTAAAYLQHRSELLPAELVPKDPGLLARCAIGVHALFLEVETPPSQAEATTGGTDADFADAVSRRLRSLRGR